MLIPEEKRQGGLVSTLSPSPPPYDSVQEATPLPPPRRKSSEVTAVDNDANGANARLELLHASFLTPPTNYVSIIKKNEAIKGSWTIDTSLAPPAALLGPPPKSDGPRPNIHLDSHNGAVNAKIRLVHGDNQPRADIVASSHNGSVQVAVVNRGRQRVNIKAHAHNGAIKIYLPRDFSGPVEHRTHNGNTSFSPAVRARVTTFSVEKGVGKSFIGEWQNSTFPTSAQIEGAAPGFGSSSPSVTASSSTEYARTPPPTSTPGFEWDGDQIEVDTMNGQIKFMFIDEETPVQNAVKAIKGWFSSVGGGFTTTGL